MNARDLVGPGFEAVHGALPIVTLGEEHELECVVRFDKQRAAKHARYAPCAAVGMCVLPTKGEPRRRPRTARLVFELVHESKRESPRDVAQLEALDALDARVDAALLALAHQPEVAPKSFC